MKQNIDARYHRKALAVQRLKGRIEGLPKKELAEFLAKELEYSPEFLYSLLVKFQKGGIKSGRK